MAGAGAPYADDYEDDENDDLLGYDELNNTAVGRSGRHLLAFDTRARVWSRANAPLLLGALAVAFFTACLGTHVR